MKYFGVAVTLALMSNAAIAATPAQLLGGPVIQGVCLLSPDAVLANAKAGLAANARFQQITKDAENEVATARAPIDADAKALDAQRASLKPDDFAQRQQAIQQRFLIVQQLAAQRSREIELTRQKAVGKIAAEEQPLIADAYYAKKCGLLFNRNSAIGGNFANDLTPDVVKALDVRMPTISFDREVEPVRIGTAKSP
ncbi:MAG TPA: OmpH family outer membrane protein [Rhizomicrobium sp.]|jgi:Skp family chaperone for outer membrane proteins